MKFLYVQGGHNMYNAEYVNSLYNALDREIKNKYKETRDYSTDLPSSLKIIESSYFTKSPETENHPIKWILVGKTGVHAFAVGIAQNIIISEIASDQDYYPSVITQSLASVGAEYAYSQIAIVIGDNNINNTTAKWISSWVDDNRYFRKVYLNFDNLNNINILSKRIVNSTLLPWGAIKSTRDTTENYDYFLNEDDYNEE